MPFNSIFIALIAIVAIIRLGLLMTGSMDAKTKVNQAAYWIVGLTMVVISWIALGQFFGVNTNGFFGKSPTTSTTTGLDNSNTNVNSNTYYGTGYEDETTEVPVEVKPND